MYKPGGNRFSFCAEAAPGNEIRNRTEKVRVKAETAFNDKELSAQEFVDSFNKATIEFQDEMASIMKPEQYETLFDLKPDERVILAEQEIVTKVFGIE